MGSAHGGTLCLVSVDSGTRKTQAWKLVRTMFGVAVCRQTAQWAKREKGFVPHVNSHHKMLAAKESISQGDRIALSVLS